jgi:hypothetical protein
MMLKREQEQEKGASPTISSTRWYDIDHVKGVRKLQEQITAS